MKSNTVDVIVVGAGPSGCAAAAALHRLGLRIALCDGRVNGAPATGQRIESIGSQAQLAADSIGLGACFELARVGTAESIARDGQADQFDWQPKGDIAAYHHVNRNLLDDELRSQVSKLDGGVVRARLRRFASAADTVHCELTNGQRIVAKLLVDATGRGRSAVPNSLRPLSPPLMAWTGATLIENGPRVTTITSFSSRPFGWIWETGRCGDASYWTALSAADRPVPNPILTLSEKSIKGTVTRRAMTWQINTLEHPLILPVGDAAGSIDPASGLGLANSFAMAISAARAAHALVTERLTGQQKVLQYHEQRVALLLAQADELSQRYAERGILQT